MVIFLSFQALGALGLGTRAVIKHFVSHTYSMTLSIQVSSRHVALDSLFCSSSVHCDANILIINVHKHTVTSVSDSHKSLSPYESFSLLMLYSTAEIYLPWLCSWSSDMRIAALSPTCTDAGTI